MFTHRVDLLPFARSDDEILIQKTVRQLAQEIGLSSASDADRFDRFPQAHVDRAAELGLLAMTGSSGVGAAAYVLALFEMAKVCPNTAAALAIHNMALQAATVAADSAASPAVVALANGELCAWLVTEEAHGSHHESFGTTATPDGDGWLLVGQKVWVVAAVAAKHYLVMAQAPQGPTLFWVDPTLPGITQGRNDPILGLRGAGIRTVYFSKVHVPGDRIVGKLGHGRDLLLAAQPWMQIGAAAMLAGCMAGAAEHADRFAESRIQFQKPIGTFQAVSDGVTEMDIQIEASLALTLRASGHIDKPDAAVWAARAKAFAVNAAIPMTRQAIRVMGGTGFMREGGAERFARDARALQFMGEPMAVQRDILRRHILAIDFDN